MRLLLLGGTWFLGRSLAEAALTRDWQVTTFSRGHSGHDAEGTECVRGDRSSLADLSQLSHLGRWDAVVDTSGHVPGLVATAARALRPLTDRYVYISTVNAYQGWPSEPLTDDSPVYDVPPDMISATPGADRGMAPAVEYGQMKAASELAAQHYFDHQCLILRPGVILGPYEYVGRLPWLLRRMQRGGRVLAAGNPSQLIQPVDVRDLTSFILDAITQKLAGAMNVTAPIGHSSYGEMLNACRDVTGQQATLVWVDEEWLSRQEVTPWTEIPLWRTARGAWNVSSARAEAAGLACRPLPETVADTWAWMNREEPMRHERADEIGLDPAKEQRLLHAWDRYSTHTGG